MSGPCEKSYDSEAVVYNSRLMKICDDYTREEYTEISLEPVYQASKICRYEIDDPGHWFTQTQCDTYYYALMELSGNPNFARDAGRFIILSKEMWVVRQFILGMVSPSMLFSNIERFYSAFSRAINATAILTGRESAEMICRPAPGTQVKSYQCDVCTGILEAIGLLFTQSFATVVHTECVHNGGEVCRFEVNWTAAPSVAWKRARNRTLLLGTPVALGMMGVAGFNFAFWSCVCLFAMVAMLHFVTVNMRESELLGLIHSQGHNARDLFKEDNIRNRHALLIKSISQEAVLTDSQDGVAQGVLSVMERHLGYDRLAFFFNDAGVLKLGFQVGYTPVQVSYFKGAGGHISKTDAIHRVLKNSENFVINGGDGFSEAALFGPDFPEEQVLEGLLAVPVIMEGQISGVLIAVNLPGKRVLTQSDLSLLIGVASQMGLSIDNVVKRRELAEGEQRYRTQVLNGLEDERRRIAFDLHDHVAQDLGSLMISARMMQEKAGKREACLSHDLQVFVTVLKMAINSVRNIAYDLQPPSLAQFGLVHTLQAYATDFSVKNDVTVDFRSAGVQEGLLKYDTMINYFRIVQESLINTVKHARASKISIRLVFSHPNLILRIRDNGTGFCPHDVQASPLGTRQMGLRNMEERSLLMNGMFRIDSSPGKGCEVVVEVPLCFADEG